MDEIESSVVELQNQLLSNAPVHRPAVFPLGRKISNLTDICSTDLQRSELSTWLRARGASEDSFALITEFNYAQRTLSLIPVRVCSDK